jgi:RHH-type transcriptional regulator, rel operon repressor / antitoxin RelB
MEQTVLCYTRIAEINMLAIRLPADIEKRLDRLAKRTGRTKTYYAREAILKHLEDLEDIHDAERRLEDLYAGRSHTVPLEKVMRKHGNLED